MRASLDNSQDLLAPGLFIRLRFPIGAPHPALLVPEEALATDQGQRCLYVVDDDDKIAYRRVQVGILRQGRRVILDGIAANDRIVVTGLQRIRPGAKVIPKPAIETDDDKQARDSAKTSEASPDQPAIEVAAGKEATDDRTTAPDSADSDSTGDSDSKAESDSASRKAKAAGDAKAVDDSRSITADDNPQENSASREEASSDETPSARGKENSPR